MGEIPVTGRKNKRTALYIRDGFSYPVSDEEADKFSVRLELPEAISAPFPAGTEVGKCSYIVIKS